MNWVVGDLEVDAAQGELRRNGDSVAVEPRVMSVIQYLLENAERVVSRKELLNAVWPDTKVSDGSLNVAIMQARQALGPSGRTWIQTLRGRGYRLTAPIARRRPSHFRREFEKLRRVKDTQELHDALSSTTHGAGGILLLTPIPPDRVLRVMNEARRGGHSVYWGHCMSAPDCPATWPWQQILQQIASNNSACPPDELQESMNALAGLPQERLPAPTDTFKLLALLHSYLAQAATHNPMAIVIEGLDDASQLCRRLSLLLGQACTTHPILLLVSLRCDSQG